MGNLLRFPLILLLPALAAAAIWPDFIGPYKRISAGTVSPTADRALWNEYGFQAAEAAQYESPGKKFSATAWRLLDSTGAMAAFQWQRPPASKTSSLAKLAATAGDDTLLTVGNYLFWFRGYTPRPEEMAAITQTLPRLEEASLPVLREYLPSESLTPNSERYILGPVSLDKFAAPIPPSIAAFHASAEAQVGSFNSPAGAMKLAIFNYPTPQIAMERLGEFAKIPGAMAKRSGPLVAVIVSPPHPDAAERLLALVRYQATVTRSEYVPTRRDNIGNLVLGAFELTGVLLLFAVVAGLAVGGVRAFLRRGRGGESDPMIVLHLSKR
jgi:hypothetical protein